MSDVVIQVDHLWKKYRLGVLGTGTLRHDFNRWLHRTLGKPDPYAKVGEIQKAESRKQAGENHTSEIRKQKSACDKTSQFPLSAFPISALPEGLRDDEMWALRDISFEVKQGEILGIIGRNGAGKSTVLKVLSRVTAPTSGEVRVKGRIASLLEVGTGFHPELTGRENIFLNGAILGMTKAEIKSKLDEIVSFAEVEKFLDTPVKRYSSGMYVRLAFAVAAHLEPEILIIDEVLAVGDAEFQKKCLGKMGEVAHGGRTILFVSHNMAAIQALCRKAMFLSSGRMVKAGGTEEIVREYLTERNSGSVGQLGPGTAKRSSQYEPIIDSALLIDDSGSAVGAVAIGAEVTIRICLNPRRRLVLPALAIGINNYLGIRVAGFNSITNSNLAIAEISKPRTLDCHVPSLPLAPGEYAVQLVVVEAGQVVDVLEEAFGFTVLATDYYGTGRLPAPTHGVFLCKADWSFACREGPAGIAS
jgi:lipopolysaccharide transport system ATP-binding protein